MCSKYAVYEKNRLKVYRDDVYTKDIVCFCDTLEEAQDLVLAFTEANTYRCFCEQCQYISPEDAVILMKMAPKYGWDKYTIQEVK